jgi:hypothetical protein
MSVAQYSEPLVTSVKFIGQLFTARRKAAEELNVISISSNPQPILLTNGMKSSILTKPELSVAVIFMTRVNFEPSDGLLSAHAIGL